MIPGMPPLNVDLSAKSEASLDQMGNDFTLGNSGAWNVNIGGSAPSIQGASSSAIPVWVWAAVAAVGVLWLLRK